MNVVCVCIDRWHAGYWGAGGNTWMATPCLDRLASEGFLFEQATAPTACLEPLLRALWGGRHPACSSETPDLGPWLFETLVQRGWSTALVTDDVRVAEHPWSDVFSQRELLPATAVHQRCQHVEETHLATLFAATSQQLESTAEPFFLWLHTQGLAGPWDAPVALAEAFREEGDPPIDALLALPDEHWPADFDPDRRVAIAHAYAAQVAVLDGCLGWLDQMLVQRGVADDTLLVVLGARGVPLGEHGHVGPHDNQLHSSLVHTPWLWRFPDRRGQLDRSRVLAQSCDLPFTLAESLDMPSLASSSLGGFSLMPTIGGRPQSVREQALFVSPAEQAVLTPQWYLRLARTTGDAPSPSVWLYAKPDDYWDQNEVADRCPDEVDLLRALIVGGLAPATD